MTTVPLPFARGDYFASGSMGAAPTQLIGSRYELDDGVELEIAVNRNGAVIYGTQACKYKNPHTLGNVELCDTDNDAVAGFADHVYAEKAKTIPVGALFYIVKRGDTYVRVGAAASPGQGIRVDAGASALAEGRVQPLAAAAMSGGVIQGHVYGYFLETGVAASAVNTGSTLARVFCP